MTIPPILGLFTVTCDRLGLHYTRASRIHISIARRPDVARVDRMLGYPPGSEVPRAVRERVARYRARSNVGSGLPILKCRMPATSCSAYSMDRRERHHRAVSNGSCGVGWTRAGSTA